MKHGIMIQPGLETGVFGISSLYFSRVFILRRCDNIMIKNIGSECGVIIEFKMGFI